MAVRRSSVCRPLAVPSPLTVRGLDGALRHYEGLVLEIDLRCGHHFADIVTGRHTAGRPIDAMDAWVAAVCRRHDVPLATRNIKDFEGTGIAVVNPWADGG